MVIEYIYFKQGDQHKFSNVEKLPPVRKFLIKESLIAREITT